MFKRTSELDELDAQYMGLDIRWQTMNDPIYNQISYTVAFQCYQVETWTQSENTFY